MRNQRIPPVQAPEIPLPGRGAASNAFAQLINDPNTPSMLAGIMSDFEQVAKRLAAATWNKDACTAIQKRLDQLAILIAHNCTILVPESHKKALNAVTKDFQRCLEILQKYVARQQGIPFLRALLLSTNGKARLMLVNLALDDAFNTYEMRLSLVNLYQARLLDRDVDETNREAKGKRLERTRVRNQLELDLREFVDKVRARESTPTGDSSPAPPATTISRSRTAVSRASARYSPKSLIFGRGLKLRMRRDPPTLAER
ncbi:hypothetical protein EXIGLDRAFT_845303 [Exidia glandulosa HHB12029]|uniref:Uncharacterized protein n=1 Tax=Exidia glandulosa HHB12029 TaxID=1314781 RepID=A0A165BIZ4_EXIGL|nr:hypothetical protein EXIGLDRAFT_845303 [Exidia glandulosa HHB12029]